MLDTSARRVYSEEHAIFRDSVRKLFSRALLPDLDRFERQGIVDRLAPRGR
jgi:hypothetical protein